MLNKPKVSQKEVQQRLDKEAASYGDLLQFDIVDSIYNETRLFLALYEWLTAEIYCTKSTSKLSFSDRFLVKVSDSVLVNPIPLLDSIVRFRTLTDLKPDPLMFIFGKKMIDPKPDRNISSKFYIPESALGWKSWNFPYLSSQVYSHRLLLSSSLFEVYHYCFKGAIFLENVFITGFLPYILNIELLNDDEFFRGIEPSNWVPSFQDFVKQAVIANVNSTALEELWDYRDFLLKRSGNKARALESTLLNIEEKPNQRNMEKDSFCSFYKNLDLSICPVSSNSYLGCSEPLTYRYLLLLLFYIENNLENLIWVAYHL